MNCLVVGCDRKYLAKYYCRLHYYRKRNGTEMEKEVRLAYDNTGLEKNEWGEVKVIITCPDCGTERNAKRANAILHPRCRKCACKAREAKYLEKLGHGKQWSGSNYFSGKIISGWKRGADDRSIQWDITNEQLDNLWDKQNGKCALTGLNMSLDHGNPNRVSLDRIDSTGYYSINNVQLTCSYVNRCKQSLSNEEFLEMCRLTVNNLELR